MTFLPYGRQVVDDADVEAVAEALRGDFLTTGPLVGRFEDRLKDVTGTRFATACSNGTAALYMAARALDITDRDVVIVATQTFLATASAPHLAGAEVVFADVDPETGLMRPVDLEIAIDRAGRDFPDRRIRAAFVVHLNGTPADMPGLHRVAEAHGIALVEDSCHAIGGLLRRAGDRDPEGSCPCDHDVVVGTSRWSDMSVFSFHPVKTVAMGEGGAVTTEDPEIDAKLRLARNHGLDRDTGHWRPGGDGFEPDGTTRPWYYEMEAPSFNFRVPDILCALGISQLDKLEDWAVERQRLFAYYQARLEGLHELVSPPAMVSWGSPVMHLCAPKINFQALGKTRTTVMNRLREDFGIGTQVHYVPVHTQPYWRNRYGETPLPGAEAYYDTALSLPFYIGLMDADIDRVCDSLLAVLEGRNTPVVHTLNSSVG